MPPLWRQQDAGGSVHRQNKYQEIIWAVWTEALEWVRGVVGDSPYAVLFNGDATEGVHHGGRELVCEDHSEHVGMFIECARPLCEPAARVLVVAGTECHTRNAEATIGEALGAMPCPETGRYAKDKWRFRVKGCPCVARHHIGTSARSYTWATQLGVQINEERTNALAEGVEPPRVLYAGHRHTAGVTNNGTCAAVTTPSWQALTRHGNKVVPAASPHFGLVIADHRVVREGELPEFRMFKQSPVMSEYVDV